ncbi:MAG: hypothetical protein U0441_19470 [Polyangiaceae bacterium]
MRAARPFFQALPFLAIAALGCVEPLQNGGVTIVGDPAQRLGVLCRFHQNDEAFCARDKADAKGARARRIAKAEDGLRGSFASGRAGDYVLENGDVAIVIGQPGDPKRGGAILDAGDATARVDALGEVIASLGGAEDAAVYETVVTGAGNEGAAYVEAQGHAAASPTIRITTRYELAPGARAVTITTTVLTTGADPISGIDLADVIVWGGAKSGAPEAPRAPEPAADAAAAAPVASAPPAATSAPIAATAPAATAAPIATTAPAVTAAPANSATPIAPAAARTAPYLFGVGDHVAYAIVRDGEPFAFRDDALTSVAVMDHGVTLAPSKPVTYSRALVIAARGDTAAIATELFYLAGGSPGGVEIGLAAADPSATTDPGAGKILLRRAPGDAPPPLADPPSLWFVRTADAPAGGELAPGKYTARFEGPRASSAEVPFEVTAGNVTRIVLKIAPAAADPH